MDPVIHFEMPYHSKDRVTQFYQAAFGWQMEAMGEEMSDYLLATTTESDQSGPKRPGAINGGFFAHDPGWPGQQPSVVIAVQDIEQAAERVRAGGGSVHGEPMEIPGVGHFVAFTDTEGNRVGILQPLAGVPGREAE